jgi:hypothetical protein
MVNDEHQDCSYNRNDKAIKIQARYAGCPEGIEQVATYNSADDPENNVQDQSVTVFIHYLTAKKAGN